MKILKSPFFLLTLLILTVFNTVAFAYVLREILVYNVMSVKEQPIQKFEVLRHGVLWVSESWQIKYMSTETIGEDNSIQVDYLTSSGEGNSFLTYVKTDFSANFPQWLKDNIEIYFKGSEWVEWLEGEELSLVEGVSNPQYYLKMKIVALGMYEGSFTLRFYSDNHTQDVQHTIWIYS